MNTVYVSRSQVRPRRKALFISVLPSPYQRDLFAALASREDIDLAVYYIESGSPDSPWPSRELRPFERIMPGTSITLANVRINVNWGLPDLSWGDVVVLNSTVTSFTAQLLMRHALQGRRWLFWGEMLRPHKGFKRLVQTNLAAPISRAYGIVGIGRVAELDYHHRFPALPHFCIPYHCDISSFIERPRHLVHRPVTFLFCGQMIARKGIDVLLQAFDRLIAQGIDAKLLLIGREAELPKYLEGMSSGGRSRVRYEGFQPPERLAEYFAQADIFVLPSRHDGWGVVINQAMAAGLPIVTTTAVGAGVDLVEPEQNGLRLAPEDVTGLCSALARLAKNPELVREWGHRSRKKAYDLTPEMGAKKWVNVLDSVMQNTERCEISPQATACARDRASSLTSTTNKS